MMKTLFAVAALSISAPALAAVQVGAPAPDFEVMSATGEPVSLSDYRGQTVVLEWTNKGCPFVQKHYKTENMQDLQSAAADDGVVWLKVNSSAPGLQGHVDAAGARAETADYETSETAYLLDADGTVGKLYNATATPHMYIVDGKGMLRYQGAIDDRPTAATGDVEGASNYVTLALVALDAGQDPSPAATRAYGCSVKYAE